MPTLGIRARRASFLSVAMLIASVFFAGGTASAAPTPVGLGTATNFAIRAPSGVMNTGAGTAPGDVGNDPGAGTQIVGLTCTPAQVTAQVDPSGRCRRSYPMHRDGIPSRRRGHRRCARRAQPHVGSPRGDPHRRRHLDNGKSWIPASTASGTPWSPTSPRGNLTLDAHGDASAVWIFQAPSDIIMSTTSTVSLINGANPCNVYWTAVTSASIDTGLHFWARS